MELKALSSKGSQLKLRSPKSGADVAMIPTPTTLGSFDYSKRINIKPAIVMEKNPAEHRDCKFKKFFTTLSIYFTDKNEFESILKNEQTDVKGDLKAAISSKGLFPTFGRVNTVYTIIITVSQIIIAFLIPFKLTFMEYEEPMFYV